MLRSIEHLDGYKIMATDGEIGKVYDFFFDDQSWYVRYLIVELGHWLMGRRVLISPVALGEPDWATNTFPVRLTKAKIKNSPDINVEQPVSRQEELKLSEYYQWPAYWGMNNINEPITAQLILESIEKARKEFEESGETEPKGDPHLRSFQEITGYHIQASDGEIGEVEDILVEDQNWTLRYLVVDIGKWFFGKKVLLAVDWIEQIDWAGAKAHVNIPLERIKESPEFNSSDPVNRKYEEVLHDYYDRPQQVDKGTSES